MAEEDMYMRLLKNNAFPMLERVMVCYSGAVDTDFVEQLGADGMPHLKEIVLWRGRDGEV